MVRATRNFDEQAESFDQRAGLPASVSDAIAMELVRLAQLGPGDLVLEVGAGTGQVGFALCQHPLRYLGFDASAAMLDVFRRRCGEIGRPVTLIHADGNGRWPADDGGVKAVFGSRAVHLLRIEHVVEEVFRVTSPRPPPPGDARAFAATGLRQPGRPAEGAGDSGRLCSPRRFSARTPGRGHVAGAVQCGSGAVFVAGKIWFGWAPHPDGGERNGLIGARGLGDGCLRLAGSGATG